MYANTRKIPKEPEINKLKTGSMAAWNIGESAEKSKEQQTNHAEVIDKQQSVKEIVRKYQETQYLNYISFVAELGSHGYCAMPSSIPSLFEVVSSDCVNEKGITHANITYGGYKRLMGIEDKKRRPENDFGTANASKKPKYDNGYKSNRVHSGWSDEESNGRSKNRNGRNDSRPQNSINRMPTGWSDDENDQKNNDRFGERRGSFQRGGRYRGRGEKFKNNDRYANDSRNNVKISSGWSDEEYESKKEPKSEVPSKSNDDDGCGDTQVSQKHSLTPVPSQEDNGDWD